MSDTIQIDTINPVIQSLSLETLQDLMQTAGYRVETVKEGDFAFLRSATNGLAFDVRPGNSAPGASGQYADFAFVALFAVRGTLPLEVLNNWNRSRRFGRLFLDQPVADQTFLVFCMDVTVVGGTTERQVKTQIELWDGLVQQLIPWLREELSKIAPEIETHGEPEATASVA